MSPSFSTKNGVRYRFYVSSALLRGRKEAAGSVPRVAAQEIEGIVETAVRKQLKDANESTSAESIFERIDRVALKARSVEVTARLSGDNDNPVMETFELSRAMNDKSGACQIDPAQISKPDQKLLQSVVRAHAWLNDLSNGTHASIENLAVAAKLHPKVIRQALRLAFLTPEITESILQGSQSPHLSLATIPFALPLRWTEHPLSAGQLNSSVECYGTSPSETSVSDCIAFY